MAATPFKASLTLRPARGGPPRIVSLSASDVADAFMTEDETGLTYVNVPNSTGGYIIDDFQLSAAGVDTTRLRLVVDGVDTQVTFRDSFLADTSVAPANRVPRGLGIGAGKQIQLKQLA